MAEDGQTIAYIVDQIGLAQVLVEITGTERITYAYGLARLWQDPGDGVEWFLGDALGSVRQLVDEDGHVVLRRDYAPFGQVVSETGTSSTGYAYTGEQFTPYNKYIYLRARWYDPKVGRFTSMDPWPGSIHQPSSLHKYLYVSANPINRVDPTGKYECEDPYHCPRMPSYSRICPPDGEDPDPRKAPEALLDGDGYRETRKDIILQAAIDYQGRYPVELLLGIATAESRPSYSNKATGTSRTGEKHPHGVMGVTTNAGSCYHAGYRNTVASLRQNVHDAVCWLDGYAWPRAGDELPMNAKIRTAVVAAGHTPETAQLVAATQLYTGDLEETYLWDMAGFIEFDVPREFGGYPNYRLADAFGHGYEGYLRWRSGQ